jgi:hypothetical protein
MISGVPVSAPAMLSVIAPATIKINPTTFADVGLFKIRIQIYDY